MSSSTAWKACRLPWMSETIATCIYLHLDMRERWKRPAAVVAAVAVAEAAAMILRPRTGLADPAPVKAESYFSPAELDRARGFSRPQLALYGGIAAVKAAALAALVRRPPPPRPAPPRGGLSPPTSAGPPPPAGPPRGRARGPGGGTPAPGGGGR